MHDLGFLGDLVIIFGVSVLVVLLLHRLRFPTITGFLLSGVLLGPHGLRLVPDVERIEVLAEVGVILLLFTIGVEFSLDVVKRHWGTALSGALLPILAWGGLGGVAGQLMGYTFGQGVFFGFLIAISSTVIPLKALAERGEVDAPQGRAITGIAVFQDLLVIPMMLLTPYLAAGAVPLGDMTAPLLALGRGALAVAVILFVALKGVPRLLGALTALRSREVFIISIFLLCLGIAWLTSQVGLSLALGAFLAGLVISESAYGHQALADIMPFRDSLTSLFFVATGMLLDPRILIERPVAVLALTAGILLLKPVVIGALLLAARQTPSVALQSGIALAQIGEFSLVLMRFGADQALLPGQTTQLFLAAAVLTMTITPLMLAGFPRVLPAIRAWEAKGWWRAPRGADEAVDESLTDHVIIVGYGFNGTNLARGLAEIGIPYVVLELNAQTVRQAKLKGESIAYGDVSSTEVLERLGAGRARALVMAISDPVSTRRAVAVARSRFPGLHIVVRTRYLAEVDELYGLGAQSVIPEEVETSLEIFSQVLECYGVPRGTLIKHARRIRAERYGLFREGRPAALRQPPGGPAASGDLTGLHEYLSAAEVKLCVIPTGALSIGRTLEEIALAATGATVLAVLQHDRIVSEPPARTLLREKDGVVLIGSPEQVGAAAEALVRTEA
jgi:CPA2 family monovalent cation:H+ antiporter-2